MLSRLTVFFVLHLVFVSHVLAQTLADIRYTYYVPIYADDASNWIDDAGASTSGDLTSNVSVSVPGNNTVVFYDHWEDGLDADPTDTANHLGNGGTTEVWGDGTAANGCAFGITPCTDAADVLSQGDVVFTNNDVPVTPRGTNIFYDGGDKIASTGFLAVTHAAWHSPVMGGATEVRPTRDWGTEYVAPAGEDHETGTDFMFSTTQLEVMAGVGGASVQIDADGDGTFEQTVTLVEGQAIRVDQVDGGGRIVSDNPVQVTQMSGRSTGDSHAGRWFALVPVDQWGDSYISPVGSPDDEYGYVIYNDGASDIVVDISTLNGTNTTDTTPQGPVTVPAGGWISIEDTNADTGVRFESQGGEPFSVIGIR